VVKSSQRLFIGGKSAENGRRAIGTEPQPPSFVPCSHHSPIKRKRFSLALYVPADSGPHCSSLFSFFAQIPIRPVKSGNMQAKKDWKDKKRHCEKGEKREFPVAYGTQIADNQQLESQSVKVRNDQAAQSFIPAKPYC
jgi:hypothetical protein